MKKILLYISLALFVGACAEEEVNPCANPAIQTDVIGTSLHIYIGSGSGHGFFEMEYGANGFAQGTGTVVTIDTQHELAGLANGTYDFYLRGNCGGDAWSDWSSANSFLIEGGQVFNCATPTDLSLSSMFYDYGMSWNHPDGDYYEVDYALEGVALGSGTVVTVSSASYADAVITKNNSYRFYVRANCGANGWSAWSTVKTFYADYNANRCLPPTNLTAYREFNGIQFNFTPDGESNHEVSITTYYGQPLTGTITNMDGSSGGFFSGISSSTTYYLYARAICSNGSRSAWTQPTVVN